MSDNINNMDFKQLRNEVQLLRDELAIMKRKYEDIIYNLDTDNFSSRFVKEQGDMRTAIEINAEGIKTKVSNEQFESAMTQTAEKIETEVKNRTDADTQLSTKITQTAEEISAEVSANYNELSSSISSVSIKANSVSSRVTSIENGEINGYTLFEQSKDTFLFDGEKVVFTGVIYLTDNDGKKKFSIFHDESQGYEQVILHGTTSSRIPLVLGDNVYIGNASSNNEVATKEWVLDLLGK